MVITAIDISVSQDTYMLPVITFLVGPPINLTGGRFPTGTGLSTSILYILNSTTGWWSAPFFTITECDSNDNSTDALYTSLYLHDYVALL